MRSKVKRRKYRSLRAAYEAGRKAFEDGELSTNLMNIDLPSEQKIVFYDGYYDDKIQHDIGDTLERMTGKGWEYEVPAG